MEKVSHVALAEKIAKSLWEDSDELLAGLFAKSVNISSPVMGYIKKQNSPHETLMALAKYWKDAFPDLKSKRTNTKEIGDGVVVFTWEAEGTHTGEDFLGMPASGAHVKYHGETKYIFNGKLLIKYEAVVDVEKIKSQLKKAS